jgi:hypothetical protein
VRYARTIQLLSCGLLVLWGSSVHAQTLAQKKPAAYGLGVSMGFASFQLQVAATKHVNDQDAYLQAVGSAAGALKFVRSINEAKDAPANMLDPNVLDSYVKVSNNVAQQSDENYVYIVKRQYEELVAVRSSYAATLSRVSPDLANAYNLGVNLAIAEGQTTAGEPARQIVYASLVNARGAAQALKLDMSELNVCIELAGGKTSLEELRNKISSVRTSYQSLL